MNHEHSRNQTRKRFLIVVSAGVAAWVAYLVYVSWFRPVNVLILTLDTTRADRIGCYGYPNALTPNIDRLAREGVLFERAFATVPLTLPSHASIFTGLYPPEHGLRVNGRDVLPAGPETLAELLSGSGYSTAAFVSTFVLDKKFGLSRGFDHYESVAGQTDPNDSGTADGVTDVALKWLASNSNKSFFCWVHYIDPHADYNSHPEVFGNRFAESAYDGEIAYVDLHIGRILRFLSDRGLDEHTLIIVAGDHGEAFGEHGERTHGTLVYNTTMQVPFVIRLPKSRERDVKISTPVSLVDVLPTVAEYLGLKPRVSVSGKSVMAAIRKKPDPDRALYFESLAMTPRGWAPQKVIVRDRWKYVRTPQAQLFDLIDDPGELNNHARDKSTLASEMDELLTLTQRTFRRRTGEETTLNAREMAKVTAGGYAVGPQALQEDAPANAPDVKEMLPYYYQTIDAEELLQTSPRQAEEALRKVVAERPDLEMAWSALGTALYRQNRLSDAVTALLRAYRLDPHSSRANETLGRIRRDQNQPGEAQTHFEEVLKARPDKVEVRIELAELLLASGKTDQSIAQFKEAIDGVPNRPEPHLGLAEALLKAGDFPGARTALQEALRLEPDSQRARRLMESMEKRG